MNFLLKDELSYFAVIENAMSDANTIPGLVNSIDPPALE